MNNLPGQKLSEVIVTYGRSLCDEADVVRVCCGVYAKSIVVGSSF